MIELRSDTFTLPTPAMRESMITAPLGDDVYGEDPTVRQLEKLAAETLGKEAACLMPSGTMANLAALMTHGPRGSKILVGSETDIYIYEAGGATVCGGLVYEPIATEPDGRLLVDNLARAMPEDRADPQFALPSVICLENTHNRCGGAVLPMSYLDEVATFAHRHDLPVHMDGARIFNAATGLGVPVRQIAAYADSIQFCLSKGLAAPVGSMLAGTEPFIDGARRVRKMLGGGMRQAGVIAAAGIVAIENAGRLAEDHARAQRLADGLATISGIELDPGTVQTNIVMFRVAPVLYSWQQFTASAREAGLSIGELGHGRIRAVTHSGVSDQDIDDALAIIANLCATPPAPSAQSRASARRSGSRPSDPRFSASR